jgi:hypothetical protein
VISGDTLRSASNKSWPGVPLTLIGRLDVQKFDAVATAAAVAVTWVVVSVVWWYGRLQGSLP